MMRMKKQTTAVIITAAAAFMCACGGFPSAADGTAEESREESLAVMETDTDKEISASTGTSQKKEAVGDVSREGTAEVLNSEELKLSCLSAEKVLELADKEELSWADLEDYQGQDIGSGMMVLIYDISKDFYLAAGGTGYDKEPEYIRLAAAKDEEYIDIREASSDQVKAFWETHRSKSEYVGVKGHVKEIHGDRILLSSDTDDFPGVFWVLGVSEAAAGEKLQDGMAIVILMEDMEKKEDNIAEYKAEMIYGIPEEKEEQEHILLTAPPVLGLSDPLSGTYSSFEVQPGNYSWNTVQGDEVIGVIACGAGPLDETAMKSANKLKVPRYNGVDKVLYNYSMTAWPDKVAVRQWDASEAGNWEAEAEWVTVCYCRIPFMELERNKIYEFSAEWNKENAEKNGAWGTAGYMFVTE